MGKKPKKNSHTNSSFLFLFPLPQSKQITMGHHKGIHGGLSCLKYMHVLVNLLFLIIGGAAIGLGVYAQVNEDVGEFYHIKLPYILFAAGSLVALVSFFGAVAPAWSRATCWA